MQTPSGKSRHASRIACSSSNVEPIEFPAPRYFPEEFADRPVSIRAPPASGLARSRDRRLARCRPGRSRMHHQKIRAQRERPHDLLMKRLHRPRPQHGIRRSQIDQIIVVNHQRPKPKFLAPLAEALRIRFGDSPDAARPTSAGSTEKICSAFAPSPCAISSDPAISPAIEVWMPMRRLPSFQAGISGGAGGSGRYSSEASNTSVRLDCGSSAIPSGFVRVGMSDFIGKALYAQTGQRIPYWKYGGFLMERRNEGML